MNIQVVWDIRCQNDDGRYEEDDDGHEFYVNPTWSRTITVVTIPAHSIRKEWNKQDGDCDFHKSILYVLDEEGNVLWDDRAIRDCAYDFKDVRHQEQMFLEWMDPLDEELLEGAVKCFRCSGDVERGMCMCEEKRCQR